MSDDRDLVPRLREVDEHLATLAPSPFVATRLRARLREEEARSAGRGTRLRGLVRPMIALALTTGIVALALQGLGPSAVGRTGSKAIGAAASASSDLADPRVDPAPSTSPSSRALPRAPRPGPLLLEAPSTPPTSSPNFDRFERRDQEPAQRFARSTSEPFFVVSGADRSVHVEGGSPRDSTKIETTTRSDRNTFGAPGATTVTTVNTVNTPPGSTATPRAPSAVAPATTSTTGTTSSRPAATSGKPSENAPTRDPSSTCQTIEALHDAALNECKQQGADVAAFEPLEPCGDGSFTSAKVACTSSPSDGASCPNGYVGDLPCLDDSALMQLVIESCAATGHGVAAFDTSHDCATGSTLVKWVCDCATPAKDPATSPGDPSADAGCFEETVGDSTVCLDVAELVSKATQLCTDKGLTLTKYASVSDCNNGGSSLLKLVCCPGKLVSVIRKLSGPSTQRQVVTSTHSGSPLSW